MLSSVLMRISHNISWRNKTNQFSNQKNQMGVKLNWPHFCAAFTKHVKSLHIHDPKGEINQNTSNWRQHKSRVHHEHNQLKIKHVNQSIKRCSCASVLLLLFQRFCLGSVFGASENSAHHTRNPPWVTAQRPQRHLSPLAVWAHVWDLIGDLGAEGHRSVSHGGPLASGGNLSCTWGLSTALSFVFRRGEVLWLEEQNNED